MFDEAAFVAAGYGPVVRSQFVQLAAEEATHVSFLKSAIVSVPTVSSWERRGF
jgi:hypothetical protein